MLASFLHSGIYYLSDFLVLGLLLFISQPSLWRRLTGFWTYLLALLLIDGVARRYVLYHYGARSAQYFYVYWISDVVLTLGTFLLVCAFFRRACSSKPEMWANIRTLLVFVFLVVAAITAFSLSKNYASINRRGVLFIMEFEQDLYFTCLVLNTLLYILMQQIETADDELNVLVCGMGLQLAGPAAAFALVFLTGANQVFVRELATFLSPLCTLGMLVTWYYAVVKMPKPAAARAPKQLAAVLAADRGAA